jgi:hypothetical protein
MKALAAVSSAGGAVDLSRIPETNSMPSITINRVGGDLNQTLDSDDDSLVFEEFEIRVWDILGKDANELMDAIMDGLVAVNGTAGGVNFGSDRKCRAVIFAGLPSLDVGDVDFGDEVARHVAELSVQLQHSPQS